MLAICDSFANDVDAKFKAAKSFVIRIGKRFKIPCAQLMLSGNYLSYVENLKYLGVNITAGSKFGVRFEHIKNKFYRTFNAIFSKSKAADSELITVQLLKSYCLPLLTYGIGALLLNKTELKSLERCLQVSVSKIFCTWSSDNVSVIFDMLSVPCIEEVYKERKINLINSLMSNKYLGNVVSKLYAELY